MSHVIVFVLIGIAFIALLLLWALRIRSSSDRGGADSRILSIESLPRPPRELVDLIFAERDWDFVSNEAGSDVQKAFLWERRSVALSWLRQTRSQAGRLMRFHRRAVRRNVGLKAGVEMRLAANYLTLLLLCGILQALIRVRDPFRARRMAGYAVGVASELWVVSEPLLGGLNPARRNKIYAAWTGK
jgi:hypothetical protein